MEGIGELNKLFLSSGLEPATLRLVEQYLRYGVPQPRNMLFVKLVLKLQLTFKIKLNLSQYVTPEN
jgi:hypothetical protein